MAVARSAALWCLVCAIATNTAAGVISFSQSTYTVEESATTFNVGFVRTGDASASESVRITSSSASVLYPADIVEFSPGETARTFMVVFVDDTLDEDDEAVTLALSNGATATLKLIDNDPTPALTVRATARVIEEDGTGIIKLEGQSGRAMSVDWQIIAGTATLGGDYTLQNGTATGKAIEIAIPLVNDTTAESPETFTVRLSNPVNATLSATEIAVTLFDDDGATPAFFIEDVVWSTDQSPSPHPKNAYFDLRLVGASTQAASVELLWPGVFNRITFPASPTSQKRSIQVNWYAPVCRTTITDVVLLRAPQNATIGDAEARMVEIGTSYPPQFYFIDKHAIEPAGSIDVTYWQSSSSPLCADQNPTLYYTTVDGTAKAGVDYVRKSGSFPLAMSGGFRVALLEDDEDEPDEDFYVRVLSIAPQATYHLHPIRVVIETTNPAPADACLGPFVASLPHPTSDPSGVFALTIGDVNADGRPDLVAGSGTDVNAFLGQTDRTLSSSLVSPGASTADMALADFNRDGVVDLAICGTEGGEGYVAVLPGRGDGTFQTPIRTSAGSLQVSRFAVGDFDRDGVADLASTAGLFRGNGDGTFAAPSSLPYSIEIAVADFNADGFSDLVVSTNSGVSILLNRGGGAFTQTDKSVFRARSLATADFNGDGKADFAVSGGDTSVYVFVGDGTGAFAPIVPATNVGGYVLELETADMNLDGKTDLVFTSGAWANPYGSHVGWAAGRGDATFESPTPQGMNSYRMTVGDLDGDGRKDIALGDVGNVTVLGEACNGTRPPRLSIASARAVEGSPIRLDVNLSPPAAQTVKVVYATPGYTTSAGDYTPLNGELAFTPGQTLKTIEVATTSDTITEDDETFLVTLSDAANAQIDVGTAAGLIIDDDGAADLRVTITANGMPWTSRLFTYVVRVSNNGPGSATNVVVTAPLPLGASLHSVSVSQGTWTTNSPTVIANLGAIRGGMSATVTIGVVFAAEMESSLAASASAAQADPTSSNNAASVVIHSMHGEAIPTLQPILLMALAALLATAGIVVTRR